MHWASLSVIALFTLVPVTLVYPFVQKQFGVGTPVTFLWYATTFAMWTALVSFNSSQVTLSNAIPNGWVILIVIGVTACSTIGTFCLFTASGQAPNPAFPFTIVTGTSVIAYFASGLMAKVAPNIFPSARIDFVSSLGILLTIVGVAIIMLRK
ncbi:hypothetical protein CL628_04395 [bacterium]|nr:hypothetical protein [bacterium]